MVFNSAFMLADNMCMRKRKLNNVKVKALDKPEFLRTRVTRKAVEKYKYENASRTEVNEFIKASMANVPAASELTRELQTEEVLTIVNKYLDADGRRSSKMTKKSFNFSGVTIEAKPDFVYKTTDPETNKTTIELILFTTGKQKYTAGSRGNVKNNSLWKNMPGLGMLLYGISLLPNGCGTLKIVSDALKTDKDKNGDFSRSWAEAVRSTSSTKGDNRAWILVDVKNGVPEKTEILDAYKETLNWWLKGEEPEHCSVDTCNKCEFTELCHYNHRPVAKNQNEVKKMVLSDLSVSKEQQRIVDFNEGICVSNAGAGSGKSHSIAIRVAKLLRSGAKPEDIAIISFSRAAVSVLVDRIGKIVKDAYGLPIDVKKIKIASFNSMGQEIIDRYYEDLGFTEKPILADDIEQYDICLQAIDWDNEIEGLDYKNPHMEMNSSVIGAAKYLYRQIKLIRDNGLSKEQYMEWYCLEQHTRDAKVTTVEGLEKLWDTAERFAQLMKANHYIDYSDQNNLVKKLMNIDQEYVTSLFDYSHIIVDEFQDSNDYQIQFLRYMIETTKFKSLLVVGDDSQSIFGFRGTSPENIVHFEEKIGEPVTYYPLTTNYRSTGEIVKASDNYIKQNKKRLVKEMKSGKGPSGEKPSFVAFDNKTDERTYIVKWIKQLIESGKAKPEEIAVISSKRSTLAGISRLLSESNILSQYDMGERILDDSRVKAALGFLEFMSDIDATKGLLEYLNEKNNNTIFSMDENTIMSLIDQTKAQITSVYEPLSSEEKKDFLLQHLKALDDGTDKIYSDFVTSIERKTLYSASDIVSYGLKMKLYDFNNTGEKEGEYEAISLVTAHSSKGKEWKYVFGSLSDFDNANIHYSQDEIEEKRRLIYVLMTRAKEHLILTCTEMLSTKKSEETSIYNRFFREIERGLKDDYDFIYHPTLLLKKTIA
jgi:DNA helicase-2/ATP-dependent DNA helicase PcrA